MQLAVELGWPRGFRGPFYEQPADVAAILRAMTERDVSANVASMLLAEAAMWQANARDNARAAIPVSDPAITPLSERETEVLALLAQRLTNKEIARRLDLSPLTVRNHASSIYSKLAVSTRKQAVAQAQRTGLLPPDPATPPPSDSARRR